MDAVALVIHPTCLRRVNAGTIERAQRHDQQALDLVGCRTQLVGATGDDANHRGDDKSAHRGEDIIELAEDGDPRRVEADLLVAFA